MTTVLLAESSKTVRKMVEIALDREPYDVEVASDGNTALAMARAKRPAIVLVRNHLPGLDGYDVARQIKSDPMTASAKVFILAGQNQPYDAGRGQAAGIDGHIVKPFITQELIDTCNKATGKQVSPSNIFATGVMQIPLARPQAAAPPPMTPPPIGPPPLQSAATRMAPTPPPAPKPRVAPRPSIAVAEPSPPPAPMPSPPAPMHSPSAPLHSPPAPPLAPPAPPPAAPPPLDVSSFDNAPTRTNVGRPPQNIDEVVAHTARHIADSPSVQGAISGAARQKLEAVIWEVVPALAEAILKEEIARVVRERMAAQ